MRTRTATGLTLALALLAFPLHAQDVQWRAAAPRTEQPRQAASGNQSTTRPVSLARPVTVEPERTIHDSAVTPVSFRPVGVVRIQTDAERIPAPLPSGPNLPMTTQTTENPQPPETIPVRPKPVPAMNEGEERIIPHDAPSEIISSSDCASCGGNGWEGGDSCGNCDSCDCSCSCVCDMCCGRGFGRRTRCRPGRCTTSCDCCPVESCCTDSCCIDSCCTESCCCSTCCSSCGGCGCGCCFVDGCNSRQYFWASAEYLLWTITPDNVPPLVTTGPITDGNQVGNPGGLNTQVLYGRNQLADPLRNGARFTAGFWLPGVERIGVEASYFFLGRQQSDFFIASQGNPILIRPSIDAQTGQYRGLVTAYPAGGVVAPTVGSLSVRNTSELWGLEANLRAKLWCGPCWWIDGLVGYRHLDLQESLTILDAEGDPGAVPDLFLDEFDTRNNFNGGQVGIEGQWNFAGRFTVGGFCKVALGNMNQVVGINGRSTVTAAPGTNEVTRGGVLALESNIGSFQANRFAVMPNCGAKIGWNATEHLRFFVGYEFLYVSNVVRVGEQVDVRINLDLIPGGGSNSGAQPRQPAVLFRTNDFWAHGVSFGALYYW